MTTLLVGFDSAWTVGNSGAVVGALRLSDGQLLELGEPIVANFTQAEHAIRSWQEAHQPISTVVLIDQPTIVKNASGQRPVENIVGSVVGRRRGGMQPANTSRQGMFDEGAPIWKFLAQFGGAATPLLPLPGTQVFETYPVLAIIASGWTISALNVERLPKYNPHRKHTFKIQDWKHICERVSAELKRRGLTTCASWMDGVARNDRPRKPDQDRLDACICLLSAIAIAVGDECIMVGDLEAGYIVVPHSNELRVELVARCEDTGRVPSELVRRFRWPASNSYATDAD